MASFIAFLVLIVTGIVCLCADTGSTSEAIDFEALFSFKLCISSDPQNALLDWTNHTHYCNWSSVACDSHSNVVSLFLPQMQLVGVISPSIGNLSHLAHLDLSSNSFQETIPPSLGKLSLLQSLSLGNNFLVGDISDAIIGNCTSLTTATLQNNKLSGPIPASLGRCKRLRALDLSSNALQGIIPLNISQLLNLEQILNLSKNGLEGEIPSELGGLSLLSSLDLSSNMLSGRIPSELGNLKKLRYLNLSGNELEGPVPPMGVLTSFNWSSFEGNDNLCGVNEWRPCPPSNEGHRRHTAILASLLTISLFLALPFCFLCYRFHSRNRQKRLRKEKGEPPAKRIYSKEYLEEMTNAFSGENIIGSSSGSIVYRGGNIAVTVFKTDGFREFNFFNSCVNSLVKIRHGNLLSVVGFCREQSLKALVTEYEANGSLDSLMHGDGAASMEERRKTFDLSKRIDVLISTAGALIHLHEYSLPSVIHGHLRPTNIYLDQDFRVRVGDFGTLELLREHLSEERRASSATQGTISYLAPEVENDCGYVTPKADVFSLGVIVMEMMTGRRAPASLQTESGEIMSLREWIEKSFNGGSVDTLADPALANTTTHDKESQGRKFANLFEISLRCTE